MKHLKTLLLCVCLILSAIYSVKSQDNKSSNERAKTENIKFVNPFRPVGKLFKWMFSSQSRIICQLTHPSVEEIELSETEIVQKCSLSLIDKSCSEASQLIKVVTKGKDFEYDVLTYKYEVSKGKIIGEGQKVIWDLSDVPPGNYSITAMVDDGCGFCGLAKTQTVTVKECPNCKFKK